MGNKKTSNTANVRGFVLYKSHHLGISSVFYPTNPETIAKLCNIYFPSKQKGSCYAPIFNSG
ncbi:hypothetical protein MHA_2459 [Mannheimia haemolytica PHL213]|uniref:hypothetical protein n=1 Tax=Mannheimia phage vB_MhS_535AP2 TaxID=1572743 RepID=UPI0001594A81|nr:hypothetical protein AVV64_gp50 [Mannheimia phage vB_MhS_535AP2]YP_009213836.1 hypothetical protein AVV62_gp51 [Mannheimia phage vB_MhS_1152AP2]AJA73446.1 hypothetical protein 3927AP1_82 [Mannheimia phage vB_MhS_3927AP1]ASW16639.1 hypothetical protein D650_28030 [Mannheimia haemolytica USDA-ARS-USMARC-183]ASW36081.1 hypothetical protein CKG23_05290 [Mannheimia haemolytica]EDN75340.1 hypothetical protein MHA_2459 [Mannheimia haemolytica PHL213]AJA73284.1 hypothetical protein 535AP2_78 [Mann